MRNLNKHIARVAVALLILNKQIRVFRRPLVKGRPVWAVETECRLQRQ